MTSDGPSPAATPDGPGPGGPAEDTPADTEAGRVLWPWVARRTKSQVIALVLISCLALGPLVALVSILRADPTPVNDLVPPPVPDLDMTRVTVTVTGLSPSSGELRTRVSVAPATELTDNGRLVRPLTVVVNGSEGAVSSSYEPGEEATPFEVSVPVAEGSTTRYPFDRYRGSLVVALTGGSGDETAEPFVFEARSVVQDFTLSATTRSAKGSRAQSFTILDFTAQRPATTTIYAVWLMVLMWGLAVTGLLIVWAVVIWTVDLPFWAFGYFVGVLFALPPRGIRSPVGRPRERSSTSGPSTGR